MRKTPLWLVFAAFCLTLGGAGAAERIRIAAQKTGTLAWELDVIRAHGLDKTAGLDLAVTELASPEGGKIALKGGSADLILADVMFVARERALGGGLKFHPYASTPGAVMASPGSGIHSLEQLRGRKLGIAGGPLDKSWLLFQAWARQRGLDPRKDMQIAYGSPRLLAVKAELGELDAVLDYWNFCAELEAKGFSRVIGIDRVQSDLGAKGPVALVGYAFEEAFAGASGNALKRYFDIAARARELLSSEPGEWLRIAARTGVNDPAALAVLRKRHAEGAVSRSLDDEEADARLLYKVLVETGGSELAGPAKRLDAGVYWRPGAGG